jgi:hypothetical protein
MTYCFMKCRRYTSNRRFVKHILAAEPLVDPADTRLDLNSTITPKAYNSVAPATDELAGPEPPPSETRLPAPTIYRETASPAGKKIP